MLRTEMRNEASMHIDTMDTMSMLELINTESMNAVKSVEQAIPAICKVCDAVVESFNKGGRLFYVGAGTSGRLGVLDAAECPPTFGTPKEQVIALIAGGEKSMTGASEANEDNADAGVEDLKKYNLCDKDIVIGISASGGARYVIAALQYANDVGAVSVSITNNYGTKMETIAKLSVVTDTGPEVITGSTRMKSGTAQKLVLNMISTSAMVKTGKVYENMMINLQPSNVKLKDRMIRIVCEILHCDYNTALALLESNDWNIKKAINADSEIMEK